MIAKDNILSTLLAMFLSSQSAPQDRFTNIQVFSSYFLCYRLQNISLSWIQNAVALPVSILM